MEIHEKIKDLRTLKRLSQYEMADLLGVGQSTYLQIEKGKTELTVKRLFEIAAILEVSPLELLNLPTPQNNNLKQVEELKTELSNLKQEYSQLRAFSQKLMEYSMVLPNIIETFSKNKFEPMPDFETFFDSFKKNPKDYDFE